MNTFNSIYNLLYLLHYTPLLRCCNYICIVIFFYLKVEVKVKSFLLKHPKILQMSIMNLSKQKLLLILYKNKHNINDRSQGTMKDGF